ncbi:hypothetical protein [Salimicrobium salexigens]|uniref:Uncharacterized protein n=1 Tax=Salimicrobium salexigens TaxID=908941 RepID=A0ABY1KS04_9BACI|nr:hypothetical protein [Salimicrobium salexigens]SIS49190.1 hypothetical protein SAMN05421758_1021 [Salimicrobium salexigens]
MTIEFKVFRNGGEVENDLFHQAYLNPILDFLTEQGIDYTGAKSCEDALEITRNKDISLICIDPTSVTEFDSTPGIITEFLLEYEENLYEKLKQIAEELNKK